MKQGTIYACLTSITPDASQPWQCIKSKQSSIPNILKHLDSFEKGCIHQVLN